MNCKYCNTDIISKNFARHLKRKHKTEPEVHKILEYPKSSKLRKEAFSMLRNNTNFDLYIQGSFHPKRKTKRQDEPNVIYYPCVHCKGVFRKRYLKRHVKICSARTPSSTTEKCISQSQNLTACLMDRTNTISKLFVKEKVSKCFIIAFWHIV